MSRPAPKPGREVFRCGRRIADQSAAGGRVSSGGMVDGKARPDFIEGQRGEDVRQECDQGFSGRSVRAPGRQQHHAKLRAPPGRIEILQSAQTIGPLTALVEHGHEQAAWRLGAHCFESAAKRPCGFCARPWRADEAHGFGIAEEAAVQLLVALADRPQDEPPRAQLRRRRSTLAQSVCPAARSSAARRSRTCSSGCRARAGGMTTVACMSMSIAGS